MMYTTTQHAGMLAVLWLLCCCTATQGDTGKEGKKDQAVERPIPKPFAESDVLFDGTVVVGKQPRRFRLTSREYSLRTKPGQEGYPIGEPGWLLELRELPARRSAALRRTGRLVWRYWCWDITGWPKDRPWAADVCASSVPGELYVAVSYLRIFRIYKVGLRKPNLVIPATPQEGRRFDYHDKESGHIAWGPPHAVLDEMKKQTGIFVVDSIRIELAPHGLDISCNLAQRTNGMLRVAPVMRLHYNLRTREWKWFRVR